MPRFFTLTIITFASSPVSRQYAIWLIAGWYFIGTLAISISHAGNIYLLTLLHYAFYANITFLHTDTHFDGCFYHTGHRRRLLHFCGLSLILRQIFVTNIYAIITPFSLSFRHCFLFSFLIIIFITPFLPLLMVISLSINIYWCRIYISLFIFIASLIYWCFSSVFCRHDDIAVSIFSDRILFSFIFITPPYHYCCLLLRWYYYADVISFSLLLFSSRRAILCRVSAYAYAKMLMLAAAYYAAALFSLPHMLIITRFHAITSLKMPMMPLYLRCAMRDDAADIDAFSRRYYYAPPPLLSPWGCADAYAISPRRRWYAAAADYCDDFASDAITLITPLLFTLLLHIFIDAAIAAITPWCHAYTCLLLFSRFFILMLLIRFRHYAFVIFIRHFIYFTPFRWCRCHLLLLSLMLIIMSCRRHFHYLCFVIISLFSIITLMPFFAAIYFNTPTMPCHWAIDAMPPRHYAAPSLSHYFAAIIDIAAACQRAFHAAYLPPPRFHLMLLSYQAYAITSVAAEHIADIFAAAAIHYVAMPLMPRADYLLPRHFRQRFITPLPWWASLLLPFFFRCFRLFFFIFCWLLIISPPPFIFAYLSFFAVDISLRLFWW